MTTNMWVEQVSKQFLPLINSPALYNIYNANMQFPHTFFAHLSFHLNSKQEVGEINTHRLECILKLFCWKVTFVLIKKRMNPFVFSLL